MKNHAETNKNLIDLYYAFEEGSELTDAVHSLLGAANVLNGLGMYYEVDVVLVLAKKLITDYLELEHFTGVVEGTISWADYDGLDARLFTELLGETKLTKEAFYEARVPNES